MLASARWCDRARGTISETAIREIREETGIEIRVTRLVGIYCRPNWYRGGDHSAVFAAERTGGEPKIQPEEVIEAGFHSPEQLPNPLIWWARQRITDAMAGKTGVVCLQDAVWPFDPKLTAPQVRTLQKESPLSPPEFYETHFGSVGDLGEVEQVPGTLSSDR